MEGFSIFQLIVFTSLFCFTSRAVISVFLNKSHKLFSTKKSCKKLTIHYLLSTRQQTDTVGKKLVNTVGLLAAK